ncbi:hypothetical protein B0H14DRAFT_2586278 [Mycena olivaceomarginata]|nr:hypothetical protein B0H14DRAFT_2586278 [Mycena olivaceomarginata]
MSEEPPRSPSIPVQASALVHEKTFTTSGMNYATVEPLDGDSNIESRCSPSPVNGNNMQDDPILKPEWQCLLKFPRNSTRKRWKTRIMIIHGIKNVNFWLKESANQGRLRRLYPGPNNGLCGGLLGRDDLRGLGQVLDAAAAAGLSSGGGRGLSVGGGGDFSGHSIQVPPSTIKAIVDHGDHPISIDPNYNEWMKDKTQNANASPGGSISPDQQQHDTSGVIAPLLTYPPIRTLEALVDQGDCPYSVHPKVEEIGPVLSNAGHWYRAVYGHSREQYGRIGMCQHAVTGVNESLI